MLGKLLKYEFKATGRFFLPLYAALIIAALISRLFISLRFQLPIIIGVTLSVILIISVSVIALIITLNRFYKNLLTNEGYLMFTLPVNTGSLIWSKLLVSFVWSIVSLIAIFIAIAIMSITDIKIIAEAISAFTFTLAQQGITNITSFILEFILICILSLLTGIILLYACMSSSLFVNKQRILFSFGAYIVFYIIGQILSSIAMVIIMPKQFVYHYNPGAAEVAGFINTIMIYSIVGTLISGVLLYLFTRYMLKNKLNLE